jgi:hypothetical protein
MALEHQWPGATNGPPQEKPRKPRRGQQCTAAFDDTLIYMKLNTDVVASSGVSFRFLDLPCELRYMVYERIQFDTRRYELEDPQCQHTCMPADDRPLMVLVSKTLPTAILASCRLINAEAKRFLAPKLALLRESERFHFVIHLYATNTFALYGGNTIVDCVIKDRVVVPKPSVYSLYGKIYTHAEPEYPDIKQFVQKVSMAYWEYPTTTTIAIRFPRRFDKDEKALALFHTRDRAERSRLDRIIPRYIRICSVQKMIEEGRESMEPGKQ